MPIAIVTVTYNSAHVLPDYIRCLREQEFREFKLYAVDNDSKDCSVDMLKCAVGVAIEVIQSPKNVGFAEGTNIGVRRAVADGYSSVLILNNDTTFPRQFLRELVSDGRQHEIVAPKIHYYGTKVLWFAGGRVSSWRGYGLVHVGQGEIDVGQFDRALPIEAATGCCMLVQRSVFERVGLFDPSYFAYCEDLDFSIRASRAGVEIWYAPNAFLEHKVSSLTGGLASAFGARMGVRNRVYYVRKNYGRGQAWAFAAAYFGYLVCRAIVGKDKIWQFRTKIGALVEGLRMRICLRQRYMLDSETVSQRYA